MRRPIRRKRRKNMSPTKKMPSVRLSANQLVRKITGAVDEACAVLNRAKYYMIILEKQHGIEIDDEQVIKSIIDLQNFASWIGDELEGD